MADFFLSNLKSTTTASQNSMKFPPCSAVVFYFIFSGAVFYTGLQVHPIPSPSGPI